MEISISSLTFQGLSSNELSKLPHDIGVEILCECGNDYFWDTQLAECMKKRKGPLSIHGPFVKMDLASDEIPEDRIIQNLIWTFNLAQRHQAKYVVMHPCAKMMKNMDMVRARETSYKRLEILGQLSNQYGIAVCIENMGDVDRQKLLYPLDEYFALFDYFPQFYALLDIGHAYLSGWDILKIIKTLQNKIMALHLHDNNGEVDSHSIVGEGSIDWEPIIDAVKLYLPDVILVLEYENKVLSDILKSISEVKQMFFL